MIKNERDSGHNFDKLFPGNSLVPGIIAVCIGLIGLCITFTRPDESWSFFGSMLMIVWGVTSYRKVNSRRIAATKFALGDDRNLREFRLITGLVAVTGFVAITVFLLYVTYGYHKQLLYDEPENAHYAFVYLPLFYSFSAFFAIISSLSLYYLITKGKKFGEIEPLTFVFNKKDDLLLQRKNVLLPTIGNRIPKMKYSWVDYAKKIIHLTIFLTACYIIYLYSAQLLDIIIKTPLMLVCMSSLLIPYALFLKYSQHPRGILVKINKHPVYPGTEIQLRAQINRNSKYQNYSLYMVLYHWHPYHKEWFSDPDTTDPELKLWHDRQLAHCTKGGFIYPYKRWKLHTFEIDSPKSQKQNKKPLFLHGKFTIPDQTEASNTGVPIYGVVVEMIGKKDTDSGGISRGHKELFFPIQVLPDTEQDVITADP